MPSPILPESPKLKANFISTLFFWWLNDLFSRGYKKNLELSDLYKALPEDETKILGDRFSEEWESQLRKGKPKQRKLLRVIWKLFGRPFIGIGFIKFFEECFSKIATPICLGYLIRYFTGDLTQTVGLLAAGGIISGQIFNIATMHSYFLKIEHMGMKIRVCCSAALYKKALKLKLSSLGGSTTGKIMNLMANDLNRFDNLQHIHYLWIGIVQTGISTFILWTFFGPACLCGLAVLILFVPFQGFLGNVFTKLRINTASKTDRRIRIMNEILSGIRAIKMHCWEQTFFKLVESVRKEEMHAITKITALRSINWSLYYTSSKITIFLTLIIYVISGNFLTAEIVFVAVSLYNNIKITMTLHFPLGIAQLADFFVAVNRVEEFLLLEERREPVKDKKRPSESPSRNENDHMTHPHISLNNVSAKWLDDGSENVLSSTSLSVSSHQLIAIVGSVGCGKSSLLQVLLRELLPSEGNLEIQGTVSYFSQEPWIFSGTIRENIVFGGDFNQEWYDEVVEACALTRDFYLLAPYGDLTIIGDRGVNLSGGQKARISLARSVYANADIILLDDPLSAVDAEVARHIFEKCLRNLLRNKIVVLVTHQTQFLHSVDKIVVMDKGKFVMQGSPEELANISEEFQNFHLLVHPEQQDISSAFQGNEDTQSVKSSGVGSFAMSNPCFEGDESFDNVIDKFQDSVLKPSPARSTVLRIRTVSGGSLESVEDFTLRSLSVTNNNNNSDPNQPKVYNGHEIRSEYESQSPVNDDEERSEGGSVSFSAYYKFFQTGSNFCSIILLLLFNILTQVLHTGSDYWLQIWSNYQSQIAPHNDSGPFSRMMAQRTLQLPTNDSAFSYSTDSNSSTNDLFSYFSDVSGYHIHESPLSGVEFTLHNQILIYSRKC